VKYIGYAPLNKLFEVLKFVRLLIPTPVPAFATELVLPRLAYLAVINAKVIVEVLVDIFMPSLALKVIPKVPKFALLVLGVIVNTFEFCEIVAIDPKDPVVIS
jgi:hypothetical protein